jgi:uncharacterized DUF497 family protein
MNEIEFEWDESKNVIRLISARAAMRSEREGYGRRKQL